MSKIKNCPFCGKEAITSCISGKNSKNNTWIIGCDTLDTSGAEPRLCIGNIAHVLGTFETEEEAIKVWNSRK